jgi:hypothetical protein
MPFKIYRFFDDYHPFVHILHPLLSPDIYYQRSSLLFWAIISVACRRYEAAPSLLSSLSTGVMKLVWEMVSIFPYSHYTVQALVLICTWPFPTSSMWTDPSLTLISIAKTISLQLGLHRPEIMQDYSRTRGRLTPGGVQEAVKTWAACFIAGQWLATFNALLVSGLTLIQDNINNWSAAFDTI